MNYNIHTLRNGLRLVHVTKKESPAIYCGFYIHAGTRHELPNEFGVAHFVEHMLFKGTEKRSNCQIINRLESVGGRVDAYTTKDFISVNAAVPRHYLSRAVELLGDIVFHSTFPEHEVEHERGVILDEIQTYNDLPSELIIDDFENVIFRNTALGHSILGTESEVNQIDSKVLRSFVERCFAPNNMVFYIHGDIAFERAVAVCERYFDADFRPIPETHPELQPDLTPVRQIFEKNTCQMHCALGRVSYPVLHPDRMALAVLNDILCGGNMGSRINLAIRERNGLAYSVDSCLFNYVGQSAWVLLFSCDERHGERCKRLIYKEFDKIRSEAISEKQLQRVRSRMEGRWMIDQRSDEHNIMRLARNVLLDVPTLTLEQRLELIRQVTPEQLHRVAGETFDRQRFTEVIYR